MSSNPYGTTLALFPVVSHRAVATVLLSEQFMWGITRDLLKNNIAHHSSVLPSKRQDVYHTTAHRAILGIYHKYEVYEYYIKKFACMVPCAMLAQTKR